MSSYQALNLSRYSFNVVAKSAQLHTRAALSPVHSSQVRFGSKLTLYCCSQAGLDAANQRDLARHNSSNIRQRPDAQQALNPISCRSLAGVQQACLKGCPGMWRGFLAMCST